MIPSACAVRRGKTEARDDSGLISRGHTVSDARLACGGRSVAAGLALACLLAVAGCARPYRAPKTLASFGIGMLAGCAAIWVAGDRTDSRTLSRVGMAGSLAGATAIAAGGAWLAGSAGCRVDPDCPDEEACREIPAPPGREPYRQCSPR